MVQGGAESVLLAATPSRWFEVAAERWQELLVEGFLDGGVPEARARRLARTVVAAIEGAVALCRAEHSFDQVRIDLDQLFGDQAMRLLMDAPCRLGAALSS